MKSCERHYNNNSQTFEAGQTITLQIAGTKVVDTGISIETEQNSYTTVKKGLYHISGDVVIDATTAGDITFQILMDGVVLPCTIKAETIPVDNTSIHTETDLMLDGCCCDVSHTFTYQIVSTTAAGSVIALCTGITKLA